MTFATVPPGPAHRSGRRDQQHMASFLRPHLHSPPHRHSCAGRNPSPPPIWSRAGVARMTKTNCSLRKPATGPRPLSRPPAPSSAPAPAFAPAPSFLRRQESIPDSNLVHGRRREDDENERLAAQACDGTTPAVTPTRAVICARTCIRPRTVIPAQAGIHPRLQSGPRQASRG